MTARRLLAGNLAVAVGLLPFIAVEQGWRRAALCALAILGGMWLALLIGGVVVAVGWLRSGRT